MGKKIRVLVVDDSLFMRKALVRMLTSDPAIEVVDTASDGLEGYNKTMLLKPDIVTLDVRMPGMDGIATLAKIMEDCPVPVLMLSSLTSEGGEVTLRALDLGAVEIIDKSSAHTVMDIAGIADELIRKVKAIAGVDAIKIARIKAERREERSEPGPRPHTHKTSRYELVVIGASTGGPPALQEILTRLPENLPAAVVVVQHMPVGFTASLSERLNNLSPMYVSEAYDGDIIEPGRCLIAPSGLHMTLKKVGTELSVALSKEPSDTLHRPSVDVLMESAAEVVGRAGIGIILTGMGGDGAKGLLAMRKAGARTFAQDEESCVVYGMPKVAVDMGGVEASIPLKLVAPTIISELGSPQT